MDVIRLLLITTIASIIPGQIIRISPSSSSAITLTDIMVAITVVSFLIYSLIFRKPLILPKKIFFLALIFSQLALTSTIIAANNFSLGQILVSSLFLLRFIVYFLIVIVAANVIQKNKVNQWFDMTLIIGIIFAFIGLLQIILIPDLSFLTIYGWDPHQNRLASSLIDPNFSGGLLTIFFAIALAMYLYKKNIKYLIATFIIFASIILTFSRSSYLALLTAVIVIGLVKSPKSLIITLLLFALIIFASPNVRNRISGALTLDETSKARIESWQNGLSIFSHNYLFGVGFNTYRFAQEKYGNFSLDDPLGGHSGAGSDSSLILTAATTGILGFSAFCLFILAIIKLITKNIAKDYQKLATAAAFFAILVHSQFVNSLFYPQIMVLIWFLIGSSYAKNN